MTTTGRYFRLESNKASSSGVVCINGSTNTGFSVQCDALDAALFSAPTETPLMQQSIDAAPTKVGGSQDPREFTLGFTVKGATPAAMLANARTLFAELESIGDSKGVIRYRGQDATNGVTLLVEHVELVGGGAWSYLADVAGARTTHVMDIKFTCQPYANMDPLDVVDDFNTDTFGTGGQYNDGGADWTIAAGASLYVDANAGDVVLKSGGVLGQWRLNDAAGATSAADASGNAHPGSTVTAVTFGKVGPTWDGSTAASFNGTTSLISVPYVSALNPAQTIVGGWFKLDSVGAAQTLIDNITANKGFRLTVTAGNVLEGRIGTGAGTSAITGGTTLVAGVWYHACMIISATTVSLYLDAAIDAAQVTASISVNVAGNLVLGRQSASAAAFLAGQLGEWFIIDPSSISSNSAYQYIYDRQLTRSGALYVDGRTGGAVKQIALHSGTPHTYRDVQVAISQVQSTAGGTNGPGVILKYTDASNYMEAYYDGGVTKVKIDQVIGGVRTNIGISAGTYSPATGTGFMTIRGRYEGNNITAEVFYGMPAPSGGPSSGSVGLKISCTATDSLYWGPGGMYGATQVGLSTGTQSFPLRNVIGRFNVHAYAYSEGTLGPMPRTLYGTIPGDAPATVSWRSWLNASSPPKLWGMLGWWRKPPKHNRLALGLGESSSGVGGWRGETVGAVISVPVTSGPTFDGTNFAFTGSGAVAFVTTAVAGQGIYVPAPITLEKNRTYRFRVRVFCASSSAVTVLAKVWTGNATVLGTSKTITPGATGAQATWQTLTINVTPSADIPGVNFGVMTGNATAAGIELDEAEMWEVDTIAALPPTNDAGGAPPVGRFEAECYSANTTALTRTVSAGTVGGDEWMRVASGAVNGNLEFPIHAWPYTPIGGGTTEMFEVWAMLRLDSTRAVTITPQMVNAYGTGASRYTPEYGTTGKVIKPPSAGTVDRFMYLGTLPVECNANATDSQRLRLAIASASGNEFAIDYLCLVPSAARCSSAFGDANANIAAFAGSAAAYKEIRTNGQGYEVQGTQLHDGYFPDALGQGSSVIGAPITFPPQETMQVMPCYYNIAADPTDSDASDDAFAGAKSSYQFSVQPRTYLLAA